MYLKPTGQLGLWGRLEPSWGVKHRWDEWTALEREEMNWAQKSWNVKRPGTRRNDTRFECMNKSFFTCDHVNPWTCESYLEAALYSAPYSPVNLSWRDPSPAEPVWWREKPVSCQPTASPLTFLAAGSILSARWTKQGWESSALPPPTRLTPAAFHFIYVTVRTAPAC